MLLSRQALEEIGGFPAVADYLAEDYQIGNRLWKKGYRNILSSHVIENVIGRMSISDYVLHQLRWARTYKACRPKGFLGYGITHILPFSLLLLLLQGAGGVTLFLLAAALALRWSLVLSLYKNGMCPKGWLRSILLLPIKDMFGFGIWIWSFFGSKVLWRGTRYSITGAGLLKRTGRVRGRRPIGLRGLSMQAVGTRDRKRNLSDHAKREFEKGGCYTKLMMKEIRIAIVGVGNCASSLIQGINFYRDLTPDAAIGLMHWEVGGYRPGDIKVVAAFDIDRRKVGKDVAEAIFEKPNCTKVFCGAVERAASG